MSNPQAPRDEGRAPVERRPRQRSAFAAAFLSLLFPGLGHAYAGAYPRALAFAAAPLLIVALVAGVVLRADRTDLLAFFAQEIVLQALLGVNIVLLIYRVIAAIDAWNVARFLNEADEARLAAAAGRPVTKRRGIAPLQVVSIGGLIAVLVVMAGAHAAVGKYNQLALSLVQCVFTEEEADASCETADESPTPGESTEPNGSGLANATEQPSPSDVLPSPDGTAGTGTPLPTLPPWDGKERLNVLLIGSD
jgi:hypothetical protein